MVLIARWSSSASVITDLLPRVSIAWPLARGDHCACMLGDEGCRDSALRHLRIVPAARRRDLFVHFVGSPGAHFVFVDGGRLLQNRIDDPPGFFDVVLSGKECAVTTHRIAKHAFI